MLALFPDSFVLDDLVARIDKLARDGRSVMYCGGTAKC